MAQFVRPTSDIATGSWTATPLWSKVDEGSPGGGTTIVSDNNTAPDNADFGCSDATDPQASTNHILRAAWNKSASGGHAIDAVLELWQGTPGTGSLIATLSVAGIGNTQQEDTYTLSAGEADSITDYAALNLRLSRQGDTGGNPNGRRSLVAEFVELELPDGAEPPVTGSLDATDPADTASIEGGVAVAGSLAATDAGDSASIDGGVLVSGSLAATDSADTADIQGSTSEGITGSLAATDAPDTAAIEGAVLVSGSLVGTDTNDTAALSGTVLVAGSLDANDVPDTASLAGEVLVSGVLSATDLRDTASFVSDEGNDPPLFLLRAGRGGMRVRGVARLRRVLRR